MDKRIVKVGDLTFGDGNIYVQSMLNMPADDISGNIAQARRLVEAECDVIRVAVPEKKDVRLISTLKEAFPPVPIVADIHFDYRIAIESVKAGADKIRINPGNIGDADRVKQVADVCRNAGIPIRVGVNSGSLPQSSESGVVQGEVRLSIVRSAIENIRLLERFDFHDIIVSVKSSSVSETIKAYRELHGIVPYPLHLGITEAGTERMGLIKSAIGIGSLLCDGIGDTIRVSLTAEPEKEIKAGLDILRSIGRCRKSGVEIISCPTCGRCKIDVVGLAEELERLMSSPFGAGNNSTLHSPLSTLKIAVMGCAVNGPGECRDADFGITGGDGEGLVFRHGEIVRKVKESELLTALMEEIEKGD